MVRALLRVVLSSEYVAHVEYVVHSSKIAHDSETQPLLFGYSLYSIPGQKKRLDAMTRYLLLSASVSETYSFIYTECISSLNI